MEEENLTSGTLPEGVDVAPTDGQEAVSDESPKKETVEALSLEEINSVLGKEFKDKDSALKAVKDTFAYVGKKKEDVKKESPAGNAEIEELKTELFFTQNPDLKDARPILEKMAKADGQTLQEAAESDLFKETLSKLRGFDESQQKETVMEGSRRFPEVTEDQQKEFSEAVGNKEKMATYVLKHYLQDKKS